MGRVLCESKFVSMYSLCHCIVIINNVLYSVICIANATLRSIQNGRHFPDDIFKIIFLNENVHISISIKISLKCVPRGPINNIPALVQIIAWRQAIIWANDG